MKYTLDRIENDLFIFVEKGNEGNQIEIMKEYVPLGIVEGDIIEIENDNGLYNFKQLNEELEIRKNDVQNLIDKLKNK